MQGIAEEYIETHQEQLQHIAKRLYQHAFCAESKVFHKSIGTHIEPIWEKHYPAGTTTEINPDKYSNLTEMLDEASVKYSHRQAYENFGASLTYKSIKKNAEQIAFWLQSQSLKRGDRIAMMMPNCLSYPIIFQAIMKTGMVAVNINPLYTASELDHVIQDSGCRVLFIWEGSAHTLQQCQHTDKLSKTVICSLADFLPPIKRELVQLGTHYIKKIIPKYSLTSTIHLKAIIQSSHNNVPFGVPVYPEDIAFLQYTGGTTGPSKGAMITHRNMIANVMQCQAMMDPAFMEEDTSKNVITALPLYHIFALMVNNVLTYTLGGLNILITNPKDIGGFVNILKRQPVHAITGVNTLYNALLDHPEFNQIDWSELSVALSGGMALRPSTADKWQQLTNNVLSEGYGLTETSPVVTSSGYQLSGYTGSVGWPVPNTKVMIADPQGNPLPIGSEGEICVQGPQVMKGYWGLTDNTDPDVAHARWFRTGDIGRMNEQGELFIVDRLKDMIIVSGFNVYPNEVEDVIDRHPDIIESACIGIDDEKQGERIKAFVVRTPESTLNAKDVQNWCREKLTGYKIPQEVEFAEDLPKSNVGKILRRALRN